MNRSRIHAPMEHAHHFAFLMTSMMVSAMSSQSHATVWPARHLLPRNHTGPRIATTASLPVSLTTVSFHTAFLNVVDILRRIALREDSFFSFKLDNLSPETGRFEKRFHIERRTSWVRFFGGATGPNGYTSTVEGCHGDSG